jgi:pyrroloquinoline quinone (PQQ) biosynthesis protein C
MSEAVAVLDREIVVCRLSAMHLHVPDVATRQLLLENLIEEERGPENHPERWLRFCESLGLERVATSRIFSALYGFLDACATMA